MNGLTVNALPGLERIPVQMVVAWRSKTVTTDPPRYVPHAEYALQFRISCPSLVLPVFMLATDKERKFLRGWGADAQSDLDFELKFMPFDWKVSDDVQVNLNTLGLNITDKALKSDPRPLVQTAAADVAHAFFSGEVITLACIRAGVAITASMLLVSKNDTRGTHGRWALKRELDGDLPEDMRFLSRGQVCGTF